ncbi:MAG: GNAT family protein [Pseudomonadota bacterium]
MFGRLIDSLRDALAPARTATLHHNSVKHGSLIIRPPRHKDYAAWAQLRSESRTFLQPYEPLWPDDDLQPAAWARRIARYRRDARLRLGHIWLVWRSHADGEQLVGGVSLTGIRYGVMQAGTLGYWIGARFVRQGVATGAVGAVIDHATKELGLSRIEAATLPDNAPSMGLLHKLGFEHEGTAPDYLRINGQWQNHALFARTRRDRPSRQAATGQVGQVQNQISNDPNAAPKAREDRSAQSA